MARSEENLDKAGEAKPAYDVGYKRPPMHTRFKPGQSGNPTGRNKGSKNLKTLFNKILSEEVSLREGQGVRKVTKAEALLRGLIVGALKGESRSLGTLFRLAEHTGHFEDDQPSVAGVTRIIVSTGVPRNENVVPFPAGREVNTE
jgi:hypothetical protein